MSSFKYVKEYYCDAVVIDKNSGRSIIVFYGEYNDRDAVIEAAQEFVDDFKKRKAESSNPDLFDMDLEATSSLFAPQKITTSE